MAGSLPDQHRLGGAGSQYPCDPSVLQNAAANSLRGIYILTLGNRNLPSAIPGLRHAVANNHKRLQRYAFKSWCRRRMKHGMLCDFATAVGQHGTISGMTLEFLHACQGAAGNCNKTDVKFDTT